MAPSTAPTGRRDGLAPPPAPPSRAWALREVDLPSTQCPQVVHGGGFRSRGGPRRPPPPPPSPIDIVPVGGRATCSGSCTSLRQNPTTNPPPHPPPSAPTTTLAPTSVASNASARGRVTTVVPVGSGVFAASSTRPDGKVERAAAGAPAPARPRGRQSSSGCLEEGGGRWWGGGGGGRGKTVAAVVPSTGGRRVGHQMREGVGGGGPMLVAAAPPVATREEQTAPRVITVDGQQVRDGSALAVEWVVLYWPKAAVHK